MGIKDIDPRPRTPESTEDVFKAARGLVERYGIVDTDEPGAVFFGKYTAKRGRVHFFQIAHYSDSEYEMVMFQNWVKIDATKTQKTSTFATLIRDIASNEYIKRGWKKSTKDLGKMVSNCQPSITMDDIPDNFWPMEY